ncbi:MAG: gliding motility-associated C-terminal domain-containing protein, partial [Paludibacteraceae bacterium]|nr:gliding motility-associated C-terminal domain-containing protein [Paludibacteraceae bacterium]
EKLKVRWYDAEKNVMDGEVLNIDTETAQTQTFFASLYSADCESDLAEITVVTDPQIPFSMDDVVSVCAPNSFDFEALAKEKVGFWDIDTIEYSFGNVAIADAKAVSEQGNYYARYIDVNGCEYTGKLFLKVNPIVTAPQLVGDTIVCQGIGTHTLTANKRGANTASQSFLWHNNGNVTLSDVLNLSTDDAFNNVYFLQAKDTVTGCVSDSVMFSVSIRDSIVFSHIDDILSCETHAVNIAERAVETFVGGTEDKIFEYSRIYENGSVVTMSESAASKVLENGRYVIDVHEMISGCKASDTVNVEFKELPELSVKGELVKCQFENLADLVAEGADIYQWQDMQDDKVAPYEPAANARFPFTDSLSEAMTYKFKLIGATTDRIVCYDSITFDVTVNKKPVALKDSTFRFCQNTGGQVIRFSSEYITSEKLKVRWYDAEKNVMDGEVLNIDTETAQTQTFFASLYSTDCESDLAEITVVTNPQIPFSMDDAVSVCAPNSFDFEALAKEKVGFWQIDTIIYSFGGAELDDAKAITEQGNYYARYIDVNGCEYTGKLYMKVNPIVPAPQLTNDTLYFCQAETVQELGGKNTITDGIVEWSYLDEILKENTINTSFANTYSYEYKVRQTDTLTNCSSDFSTVVIVIESLNSVPLPDTTLCPGETLNLVSLINSHVKTENTKVDVSQSNMTGSSLESIDKAGSFIVKYSLTSCVKYDSITVKYFKEIKYDRTQDTAVCFGDNASLFAESLTAEKYSFYWNKSRKEQDLNTPVSMAISESSFVNLTVYDRHGCSKEDSLFVTVNKRPDPIASLDTTIEYCFKAETEVIDVKPTENNTLRWYLPNGESTVSAVKPSSLHSGKFTYSIVQTTPEGCEGDTQHVFVTVLDSISERPVMDTSRYCQNSITEPLAAIVKSSGYSIHWYDSKKNELPNGFEPNSETVGMQTYFASLKKGLCESELTPKYVIVNAPMKETPVADKIDLCQNTGSHTLQVQGSVGATLNWYLTEIDNKREDSIIVSTDNAAALEYTYWVSQSDNSGCESKRVPVSVEIHKALTSARLKDTFVCKPNKISYMEILKNNRIDYTVDKVLKGIDKKSAVLTKEISEEDTYLFYLTDGYCDAVDTLTLKSPIINSPVVKVEDKTFCHGDSVSMVAQNVDGVDFRWEMNGESSISDNVSLKITEDMKIDVIAIDRATFCESEPHSVQLSIYPKQEVALQGKTNICFGDTLSLLAYKGSNFRWFFDNDTVEGDKLVLAPQKSLNVTVQGIDNNSCPIYGNFNVNVLPTLVPQILGNDKLLTRNDTSVVLYALPNNDDRLSYHWSFGDGLSDSSYVADIEHLYSSELVKIGNPFEVTLTVSHEYGCSATTSAVVGIDPNFTIPNTFAPDENDPSTWFMKNYEVQIYDRVGILIYEGKDGWDGTYNGEPAFKDTYFYVIPYYVNGDKKFKTGYITLVREND